jgi:formate dehydrogenase subunit gamma
VGERWVHGTFAVLVVVGLVTAALLYVPALSQAVGQRPTVRTVHVVAGLLLPAPLLVGWLASAAFRADVRRLDRFSPVDVAWLRTPAVWLRADHVGRFNGGQKLYAAVALGAVLVLLLSGTVLLLAGRFPLDWRVGATFVHDWTAWGFGLAVVGHVVLALRSLRSPRSARVPR